jgi:hypothetical protein
MTLFGIGPLWAVWQQPIFLQMAHLKTFPNLHHSHGAMKFATQISLINYPDYHHLQEGLEICHTNFTST